MSSTPAPFGFLPPGAYAGLRRSVIDPETGNPVVTSTPTGEVVQRSAVLPVGRDDSGALVPAVPGLLTGMADAAAFPGQVARGEASIRGTDGRISDEAVGKAFDLAGTAMTGSLPFGAPKGALRMFGGIGKDDPLAALEAGLSKVAPEAPLPGPRRMDPSAQSWDLYRGSNAGPDFKRFDASAGQNPAERGAVFFTPDAETAGGYASTGGAQVGEAGPRVFRTTVEPGRTAVFDLGHLAETNPEFNARARQLVADHDGPAHLPAFDRAMADFGRNRAEHAEIAKQVEAMGYPVSAPDGLTMGYGHIGAAVRMAKEQGLDTAILRGLAEHGGDDQVVALTPGRVRSFYAPDQLLYQGAPFALGGAAAATALGAPSDAQAAPLPPTDPKGSPMTPGIPFGFGFGALPIPNADPDDPRRLVQRLPFDPAQPPEISGAADMTGPAGALVHHPGWSATGGGPGRGPAVAMDEAETQRMEAQSGMMPGGAGVQVGQQARYPGLAELFDRNPMGAPQAFEGSSGTIAPGQGPAPQAVPLPPARPLDLSADASEPPPTRYTGLGLGGGPTAASPAAPPAAPTDAPPARVPFGSLAGQPARPAPSAAPQAQAPAQAQASMQASTAAPAADKAGPGFLSRLGDPRVYNTLLGIGQGLLTTKGLGPGIAAGTAYASKLNKEQAVTDLSQAEYGLKSRKATQEAAGNNATVAALVRGGYSQQDALSLVQASSAGHREGLQNALNNLYPKDKDASAVTVGGTKYWLKPGEKPVEGNTIGPAEADKDQWQLVDVPLGGGQTQKQWVKKGEAAGTSVGQPSPPDKPQGFDVESKLRGEFAKGVGSFQDVHDGYGRVIAATRQRQDSPDGKSPAADISLIFGYMKMLDPGSVVREGEYATAANAAGIPERIRNAYNKAKDGEFLTPEQRQDFLGQAHELYGTARKTAEGVAGRYRNLAGQYGVDPERSVYLPEMPTAPTVGPNRMRPPQGQTPGNPAGTSRSDLETEARRRGLLR